MWFIIFQARAHYLAESESDFNPLSLTLHYLQFDVQSFSKLLHLLCHLILQHKNVFIGYKTDKLIRFLIDLMGEDTE